MAIRQVSTRFDKIRQKRVSTILPYRPKNRHIVSTKSHKCRFRGVFSDSISIGRRWAPGGRGQGPQYNIDRKALAAPGPHSTTKPVHGFEPSHGPAGPGPEGVARAHNTTLIGRRWPPGTSTCRICRQNFAKPLLLAAGCRQISRFPQYLAAGFGQLQARGLKTGAASRNLPPKFRKTAAFGGSLPPNSQVSSLFGGRIWPKAPGGRGQRPHCNEKPGPGRVYLFLY